MALPTDNADPSHDGDSSAQAEDVKTALKSVLPKLYSGQSHETLSPLSFPICNVQSPLTLSPDILVQNFLNIANYQYYTCFPPQLQAQCAEWWADRANSRRLSPEFTCLLLQVCASSTQFVEEKLRIRLESELGEKIQTLTESFHAAALKLSATIPPGDVRDPVTMVQQLFLGAVWFKYEAKMIEAWHAIGSAIRAAQESGMNNFMMLPKAPHAQASLWLGVHVIAYIYIIVLVLTVYMC